MMNRTILSVILTLIISVFVVPGVRCTSNFITSWNTSAVSTGSSNQYTIALPLVINGQYNAVVSWGDGSSSTITSYTQRAHSYANPGFYTVNITGLFQGFTFNNTGDKLKLSSISQFGPLGLVDGGGYFYGCANLIVTALDSLNLAGITSMQSMFSGCTSLTTIPSANNWDTSAITSMNSAFENALRFNQDISNWDTSSVTDMSSMFNQPTTLTCAFNQPIGSWNTQSVTSFNSMFHGCKSFNQPLGAWDTSSAQDMSWMFSNAVVFNQPIRAWNTSAVTTMYAMFSSANAFNQDINPWDTSSVNSMYQMFYGAAAFNQNLTGWNTQSVQSMSMMFLDALAFNGDVSTWNTANVNNMAEMFYQASSFNQPVGTWNTESATSMQSMFGFATSFNQDISQWDVRKVTSMLGMLTKSAFSKSNYNLLLVGWWNLWGLNLQKGVILSSSATYSAAPSAAYNARLNLVHARPSGNAWVITDAGSSV